MVLKMGQQVVAGHQTAGDEVLRHPIGGATYFEGVGEAAVRKYVPKQQSLWPRPPSDARQRLHIVAHLFAHFHRNRAIETAGGVEFVRR